MLRTVLMAVAMTGLVALGCSLKKRAPNTCLEGECPAGQKCSLMSPNQYQCVTADGGVLGCVDDDSCADGGACEPTSHICVPCVTDDHCHGDKGACESTTHTCVACVNDDHCHGDKHACLPATNSCVECVNDDHCGGDKGVCDTSANSGVQCLADRPCTTATTPICDNKVCRGCKSDGECTGPGVCMEDGHCAAEGDVPYVEIDPATCPNTTANGSSAKPYCAPNDAVAALSGPKRVIIIRGPMDAKMAISTNAVSPVVIGRKNAAGDDASIPAGAGTAVLFTAGDTLIRDLKVVGGTGTASKGIVVTGAATKVRLLGVRASLTPMGLGIQADGGAQLRMDRCLVDSNPAGGILINGASYDIQNTIVANNGGYGIQINASVAPSRFSFNTVASNPVAATCNLNSTDNLDASIIIGPVTNCPVTNTTVTSTSSLGPTFHLTASLPCPNDPTNPPDHDVDGDPRPTTVDCGADQYR